LTDNVTFNLLLMTVLILAPIVAASLLFTTAPYGRHNRKLTGPGLPTRLAWVVMESPAVLAFAWFFFSGTHAGELVPLLLLLLWASHYVHRAFIYPFQMRVREGDSMPVAVVAMGFTFNFINAYLNASWIGTYGSYVPSWLGDPRFLVGVAVFAAGWVINRQSDAILRGLRKPGESGYRIPRGGFYRWVSCPNYFGELLTWVGWTIATWSLAGLAFAVFTAANLVPRALANHRWYRKTFDDYPAERRAVIPLLL
jgi:protein-S-isoprenylcysteine O-methyltransferase Ste14